MAEPVDLTVDNLTVKDTSSLNKVNINDGLLTVTGNSEVIFDTPFLKIAKDTQIYSSPTNQEILIHKQGKTSQREFGDGTGAVAYTKLVSLKGDTTLDIGGKDFNFSKNSSAKNQVNNNQVDGDKSYNVEVGGTHSVSVKANQNEISRDVVNTKVNNKSSGAIIIDEKYGAREKTQTISGINILTKESKDIVVNHSNDSFTKNASTNEQKNITTVSGDKSYKVEVGGTHSVSVKANQNEISRDVVNTIVNNKSSNTLQINEDLGSKNRSQNISGDVNVSKSANNVNVQHKNKDFQFKQDSETANLNTKISGQATVNKEFGSKNFVQNIAGDVNVSKSANNVNAQHTNKDFKFKQDSVNIVRNVTVSENQTYNNVCLGTKTFSATAKTSNINYKSDDHVFKSDNNTASYTKKANTFTIEESLGNKSRNQTTNANVINKTAQNAIVNHSNLNFNRDTKTAGDWKSNTASKTYSYKVNSEQEFDYNVSSGMSQNLVRSSGMSINNECSTEQDYNTSVKSKGKLNISYSANEKVKNSSVKSETNNVNVDGNKTVSKKAGGTVQTEYTSKKLIQKLNTERQSVENNIPKIFYAQKSTVVTRDIGLTDDNLVAVKYQNAVLTDVEYKASGLGVRNVSIRKDNKDLRELIKYKGLWYKLDVVGDSLQWQKYSDQEGMEIVSDSIEARSKK